MPERVAHVVDEVAVGDLAQRDVHAHRHVRLDEPAPPPPLRVWQALRSISTPSGAIRPESSAIGMNSAGDTARSPAGQRASASKPCTPAGAQVDDRLEERAEATLARSPGAGGPRATAGR